MILATTLEFLGTLLIGVSVLRVHLRIVKDQKIDREVLREIKQERYLTMFGLTLIVLGYILAIS